MPEPDIAELQAKIKEKAKQFADEHLNNPTDTEYLLIENCMTVGWELGVRQSIEYMREHGVKLG